MRRLAVYVIGAFYFFSWYAQAETPPGQDKYVVLARVLQPFCSLFRSKAATKAMQAEVVVLDGPVVAAPWLNQPVDISLQIPDKLRIETRDHKFVFCRVGQRVWVHPGDLAEKIIATAGPPRGSKKLPDFRLPFKDHQLLLLPVLFQIQRFEPETDADGSPAWLMDLSPAPAIIEATKSEPWLTHAVINQENFRVSQLKIQARTWNVTLSILSNRFVQQLPPETWQPDPEIAADMGEIPPELFGTALEKLARVGLE